MQNAYGVAQQGRQHCGHEECACCNADLDLQHAKILDSVSIWQISAISTEACAYSLHTVQHAEGVIATARNAQSAMLVSVCCMHQMHRYQTANRFSTSLAGLINCALCSNSAGLIDQRNKRQAAFWLCTRSSGARP